MNRAVLDTGILIRYLRGQSQAKHFFNELDDKGIILSISIISALELMIGCMKNPDEMEKTELFIKEFQCIDIDFEVSKKAAFLIHKYPSIFGINISRSTADALIVASAWEMRSSLYTLNTRQFSSNNIKEVSFQVIDQTDQRWI